MIRHAFSILEMLIVLIVIGILAAAAAPSFVDSLMNQRVESAARRIKLDIELARNTAMAKSEARMFEFINTTTYELHGMESLNHPGETYTVDLSAPPYNVAINSIDFAGLDHVTFTGHGLPNSGGEIIISAGSHTRTIQIDASTGRVTIESN